MIHRRPISSNIKIFLFLFALCIVVGILLYTQSIVQKLQQREFRITELHARAMKYLGSEKAKDGDLSFVFDEIVNSPDLSDFPIIMTDGKGIPSSQKNIDIDPKFTPEQRMQFLLKKRDELAKVNPPLIIRFQDTTILHYIYYDESSLVKDLRRLPFIEIILAAMFILFGYAAFSYIKRNEQAHIWIGLSKETAHQLGTPLSSLLGWIELLRSQTEDPLVQNTIAEMEQDVDKLNRTAHRFSKIGSQAELVPQDVVFAVNKVAEYFRVRAPRLGKKVEIVFDAKKAIIAPINAELFEWVIENLLKNALDAIEGPAGRIIITVSAGTDHVTIDVIDNGKGVEMRRKKDIFRPGVSTKKRGWGIGLSLSKRIIENYHKGKLSLIETAPGKGSTFRIKLPIR